MLALALFLLAADPTPLEAARGHFAQGKLEDLLFDLNGQSLADEDKPPAAELLGKAAGAAWKKDDSLLALQFAQMALKLKPDEARGLEFGSRAARAQQQYSLAEEYADRWVQGTGSARSRLLRAELATDQGEWDHGLDMASAVKPKDLSGEERTRLELVKKTCRKELDERKAAVSSVKVLEQKLELAAEKAKREKPQGVVQLASSSNEIILYGTSWCGYCAQARRYFHAKGVSFVDKDIEREPGAAEELATKLAAAGKRTGGVPVIDVRGSLVVGFDRPALERLLR